MLICLYNRMMSFHVDYTIPPSVYLMLLCGVCYLLGLPTRLPSDGQAMYESSRAIAFRQSLALEEDFGLPQIRRYPDGQFYSQYDIGLPLFGVPLLWLGDALAAWQLWHRYGFALYLVQWLSVLGGVLAVGVCYHFSLALYGSVRVAILTSLALGLASPVWVYSRLFFAEGLLAGLLALSVWFLYREKGLWAGLFLGLAILTRAAMAIYFLPMLIYSHQRLRFSVFSLAGVLGLLFHNWLRAHDPLTFGYGGQSFGYPYGVLGFLASPDKSLFVYAPPLLLGLRAWPRRPIFYLIGSMALVALFFYGSWWAWGGGWSWGPRFLVPLLPLLILPLGEFVGEGYKSAPIRIFWGLFVLGVLINGAGVLTDVNRYYAAQNVVHYNGFEGSAIWDAWAQILQAQLEPMATFHLDSYGWLPLPAFLFPLSLGIIGVVSLWQLRKQWKE